MEQEIVGKVKPDIKKLSLKNELLIPRLVFLVAGLS